MVLACRLLLLFAALLLAPGPAVAAALNTTSTSTASRAQDCARASLSAAPAHAGRLAAGSPCTGPGSTVSAARFAVGCCVAAKAGRRTLDDLDLDALSRSGGARRPQVGAAPRWEVPHGHRWTEGPRKALGQEQLDDILTAPRSRVEDVTSGNFAGGFRVITSDGRGATFDSAGRFQYFGEY